MGKKQKTRDFPRWNILLTSVKQRKQDPDGWGECVNEIVSLLQEKQTELSRKYYELENLQGELPNAYGIIQADMQKVDDVSECVRAAICNLERAVKLERDVI